MTSAQIKRLLSGLDLSTTKNEVLVIPYFRTIISETRQGIDGESDQLRFDYDTGIIRIKDYYYKKILTPIYPYNIDGRKIFFVSSKRRLTTNDVILIADYTENEIRLAGNIVSNDNFVLTLDRDFTFDASTQKMFYADKTEFNNSVPSPRNPLVLLQYEALSDRNVDTYIDFDSIVGIDTHNATIDTSRV